jgi:uncharacterized repeat protein (TIGR01451 family)
VVAIVTTTLGLLSLPPAALTQVALAAGPGEADLEVAIVAPASAVAGDSDGFDYTITVDNLGDLDNANGHTVTLPLAGTGLSYDDALSTPACEFDEGTNTVTCSQTAGLAAADSPDSFDVHVTVAPSVIGDVAVTASVAANDSDADPDATADNDSDEATVAVVGRADLSVVKSDGSPASAVAGQDGFAYTITVTNHGPSDNDGGFSVTDALPPGLTFAGGDCTAVGQTVTCTETGGLTASTVEDANQRSFTVEVTIDPDAASVPENEADEAYVAKVLHNSATVSPNDGATPQPDPDAYADTSPSVDTTVTAEADLEIVDFAAAPNDLTNPPAIAGNDVTFTVEVHNAGPSDAGGYTVTADLPGNTSLIDGTDCTLTTSEDIDTITCDRSPLSYDQNDVFSFTLDVHSNFANNPSNSETLSVAVAISSSGTPEPAGTDPANNAAALAFDVVARADLSVSSASTTGSVASDLVYANADPDENTATFTFEVSNAGPSDAQDVVLSAPFPAPVDTTNARYCVTTVAATCDPGHIAIGADFDGDTAPMLLGSGTTAVFVIELHADPDIPVGETSFTVTAAVSSTTPRTDGSPNDGLGVGQTDVSTVIRVFTRPGPVGPPEAVPGNGSGVVSWGPVTNTGGTDAADIDYLVTIVSENGGGIHFVAGSGITSNPQTVETATQTRLAIGDDTHHVLDNPTTPTSPPFLYLFTVEAVNAVGTSDGLDSNSISPTPNASAEILTNANGSQTTGTGVVSPGDPVVAKQSGTFTSAGSIGTLEEDLDSGTSDGIDPLTFCGNLPCTGNEVVINKLTDPATGRYLIDLLYAKGVATGTGKKVVYFDQTPGTPDGLTTLASCPKNLTNASVDARTPACIVKLISTPAQNPALRIQISINRLLTDPALAVRK